ncbi:MAG: hypothetical protein ACD_4C00238G0004 [uncultured bacterium (gcode 4)]|uniref:Uncharacterized protein n=1 Tax=uncultured bacterium (gcode 4) TaxID=1234023 RepID=K2GT92_9BACT|nr:MAG: hypothetical protein ACD_4C00238G0004 [uncultured bacterium (gcode 4)]
MSNSLFLPYICDKPIEESELKLLSPYDIDILSNYNDSFGEHIKPKQIITMLWRSWAWKSFAMKSVMEKFRYKFMYNLTDRNMRGYEKVGWSDYFHVSTEVFRIISQEKFISWRVPEWKNKNYYWLLWPTADKNIIALTPAWIETLRKYCVDNNIAFDSIFIHASSDVCEKRMIERWDDEKDIKDRLEHDEKVFSEEKCKECSDYSINSDIPKDQFEFEIRKTIMQIQNRVLNVLNS